MHICLFQQLTKPVDFSANPLYEKGFRFYDQSLLEAIRDRDPIIFEFFRNLALCHTVMPDEKNGIKQNYKKKKNQNVALNVYFRQAGLSGAIAG